MSLQGNLTDLPLIDLVQVLTLQTKNGILSVNHCFSQAQVCFSHNKIYSAIVHHTEKSGQLLYLHGEEALYDLLRWSDGQFSFELISALPSNQNVYTSWDYLILEHCRRQDEAQQQQALFSKLLDSYPRLSLNPPVQAEITLSMDEWQILLQVNGYTSPREIAAKIRQSPAEVVTIIQNLEKAGLILMSAQVAGSGASGQAYQSNDYQPQSQLKEISSASCISGVEPEYRGYLPTRQGQLALVAPAPLPQLPLAHQRTLTIEKPKIQHGLLHGIMSKIRSL